MRGIGADVLRWLARLGTMAAGVFLMGSIWLRDTAARMERRDG